MAQFFFQIYNKNYGHNATFFWLKNEISHVLIAFFITEIKQSQAVHRGRYWRKNGKFSKGHEFWPWTIQILFVQFYIVIPFFNIRRASSTRSSSNVKNGITIWNWTKSIWMVHGQKSCPLENMPFLRQNRPRWTVCDCFISLMKKAIKTCNISFFSPKKDVLCPYFLL